MSLYVKDSIVALATPRGIGALSVIRVSGNSLSSLFKNLTHIKKIKPRYAYYKPLVSEKGELLDNVIIIYFEGPNSFTGEDMFEISCHGGDVVANNIIKDLIGRGCRFAGPGEFSKRSFLNGKMNLSEAESIKEIIQAQSSLGVQKGLMGLNGSVNKKVDEIKDSLIHLLTILEHELDFVEGEVSETSDDDFKKNIDACIQNTQKIISGSLVGKKLKNGFKVALIGRPNAGKSSLFNSILGYEHAITSDKKGTTRDAIEVFVEINGLPITLIDTAGHWSVKNKLDALGVEKTNQIIKRADILIVIDEKDPKNFVSYLKIKSVPCIYVSSKLDIKDSESLDLDLINVSSTKNINIDKLLTELSTVVKTTFFKEDVFLCSARQVLLLEKSLRNLSSLQSEISNKDLTERAFIVRSTVDLLREVFGEIYNEEVLNNVFSGFCVGK